MADISKERELLNWALIFLHPDVSEEASNLHKEIEELLAQPEQEPISENILNDLEAQIEQYENQMAQIDEICVNYICSKGKKDPLTKDLINSIHKVV